MWPRGSFSIFYFFRAQDAGHRSRRRFVGACSERAALSAARPDRLERRRECGLRSACRPPCPPRGRVRRQEQSRRSCAGKRTARCARERSGGDRELAAGPPTPRLRRRALRERRPGVH
eukprot:Amastigsp_a6017_11.p3 type:complete len:118 gc:universal Amastigsp_a6017_11:341-694(+)